MTRSPSLFNIKNLVYKKISDFAPHIIICDDTNLESDLGLDSLDITALLIEIEEQLNVDLNSIPLTPIKTVDDIITNFQKVLLLDKKTAMPYKL